MVAPAVAALGKAAMGAGRAGKAAGKRADQIQQLAESAGVQVSQITAIALRTAWQTLIASFGLTLLYINFHFAARYLAHSRKFSEFGTEWNPRSIATGKPNFGLKYAEIGGMIFLDLLILLIVLSAIVYLAIIGWVYANPIDAATVLGTELVSLITG